MKKLISILLGFILMSGSVAVLDLVKPQVATAITPREFIGVGVDNSASVIPACSTFGYSINTSVATGFGSHVGNGIMVDDANNRLYAVLNTAAFADPRVLIYDLDLSFINSANVDEGSPDEISGASFGRAGMIVNSSGRLMQFFERNTTALPACSGSLRCMGLRIFNGNFQESAAAFTGLNSTGALNCTFEDSNTETYCFRGTTAGGNPRLISAFNEAGVNTATVGTAPNSGENTTIVSDSTNIYGLRTATSTLWSMTRSAGVVSETAALTLGGNAFGMLVDAGITIIDGDDGTDIVIAMDNNVATPTTMIRVEKTGFTEAQVLTLEAADAGIGATTTEQNGLVFDDVNVTIHSTREGTATNMFRRIGFTPTLSLQNVLTRGTCTAAVASSTCIPSARFGVDYSRTNAALYVITSELNPRIIKVDVCATGGP